VEPPADAGLVGLRVSELSHRQRAALAEHGAARQRAHGRWAGRRTATSWLSGELHPGRTAAPREHLRALYWRPDNDPESKWNIVYDLERQEFRHVTTFDDPPAHFIPTRGLSEPSEFFGRVAQISDQELVARAKTLFDRFTNYQIAVVTLRGMSADEVAKVFERINSTHTPLTVVDLIRAAT
jgi:hypothetical protein